MLQRLDGMLAKRLQARWVVAGWAQGLHVTTTNYVRVYGSTLHAAATQRLDRITVLCSKHQRSNSPMARLLVEVGVHVLSNPDEGLVRMNAMQLSLQIQLRRTRMLVR